ncbi:MAG: transposase [Sphingomonas sp.]|nr:transposase [Sphingomonas sp.]
MKPTPRTKLLTGPRRLMTIPGIGPITATAIAALWLGTLGG